MARQLLSPALHTPAAAAASVAPLALCPAPAATATVAPLALRPASAAATVAPLALRPASHQLHRRLCQQRRHRSCMRAQQQQPDSAAPWSLTFDLRERETVWTEENQARLMALVTAQTLQIPMPEMEARLDALVGLLPDLAGGIQRLQPALLASLTSDLQVTSRRILALRELLPDANVSKILASRPQLLLLEAVELEAAVRALEQLLQVQRVDRLVEAQPLLLVTECVEQVLSEIRRLMPSSNAAALLCADPDWMLRVQRGQEWLGQNPDSQLGELVDWQRPGSADS